MAAAGLTVTADHGADAGLGVNGAALIGGGPDGVSTADVGAVLMAACTAAEHLQSKTPSVRPPQLAASSIIEWKSNIPIQFCTGVAID